MLKRAHLILCPHFANTDPLVRKSGNMVFPPSSELSLKSRVSPSKKRKTIPLSQPRSSQLVLKSLLCRSPEIP